MTRVSPRMIVFVVVAIAVLLVVLDLLFVGEQKIPTFHGIPHSSGVRPS